MEFESTPPLFTRRHAAWVIGIASLVMFLGAMVAELYARQRLILPADAGQTVRNLVAEAGAFRLGMLCYVLVLLGDALASWALYVWFALDTPGLKSLARLMAWLRLLYTAVYAVALAQLLIGFKLATGTADDAGVAMHSFLAFETIWAMGMLFFGLHLVLVGYLCWRSTRVPNVLGWLLCLAGGGYFADNLGKLLLADYAAYQMIFAAIVVLPAVTGEVGLGIWMLVRGRRA